MNFLSLNTDYLRGKISNWYFSDIYYYRSIKNELYYSSRIDDIFYTSSSLKKN